MGKTEKSFRTGKMKFLLLFLSLASIKYDNVSGATIELFNIEGIHSDVREVSEPLTTADKSADLRQLFECNDYTKDCQSDSDCADCDAMNLFCAPSVKECVPSPYEHASK